MFDGTSSTYSMNFFWCSPKGILWNGSNKQHGCRTKLFLQAGMCDLSPHAVASVSSPWDEPQRECGVREVSWAYIVSHWPLRQTENPLLIDHDVGKINLKQGMGTAVQEALSSPIQATRANGANGKFTKTSKFCRKNPCRPKRTSRYWVRKHS